MNLTEDDWALLIDKIQHQRCTPFLGAGASFPMLPLGAEISKKWAELFNYPFPTAENLAEVAQFVAVTMDPIYAKEQMVEIVNRASPPNFRELDEPHAVLADLKLPIYLTTNYDNYLSLALRDRCRDVKQGLCKWDDALQYVPSEVLPDYKPTVANPLVYHLHGYAKPQRQDQTFPETLVLTEDDYLTFLASLVRNPALLPNYVIRALDTNTCLFIGYRLADWNFRVLFQGLRPRLRTMNFAVLKPPTNSDLADRQRRYLDKYYGAMSLKVYWGTAREFAAELRRRWEKTS